MATDYRALCAELADELERCRPLAEVPDCLQRARAALAQPEPEAVGPTDEELLATLDKATADFPPRHPEAENLNSVEYPLALELRKARAVLARWGRPAPVPVEGEVAELVAWLREQATWFAADDPGHENYDRAADLLEQRHPAPVPVNERLPGAEDCDEKGRCWLFSKAEKEWRLIYAGNPGVPHLKYCSSHWLPAHALPLPAGEVEP